MTTLRDLKNKLGKSPSIKTQLKFNYLVRLYQGKNVVMTSNQFNNFLHDMSGNELDGGSTLDDLEIDIHDLEIDMDDFELDGDFYLQSPNSEFVNLDSDSNKNIDGIDLNTLNSIDIEISDDEEAPPEFQTDKTTVLRNRFVYYFNMAAKMEPHKLYKIFVDEVAPKSNLKEVSYKNGQVFHWSCGKVTYEHILQNNLGSRKTGNRPPGYMSSSVTSTALETFKIRKETVLQNGKWNPLNPNSCTNDEQIRYSAFLLYVMQNFALYGGNTKNKFRDFVEANCDNEDIFYDDRTQMDLWSMNIDSTNTKVYKDPDYDEAYMVVTRTGIVNVTHKKTVIIS